MEDEVDGQEPSNIRTAFRMALERSEIKGCRVHDLRHTSASHMVMGGASLKDVQEILGHADLERLEGLTSRSTPGAAVFEPAALR